MRKLLCCAASSAALILAVNAADTAAPKRAVPGTPTKTQSAPKPAAAGAKATSAPTAARPAATSKPAATRSTVGSRTGTAARRTTPAATPKRPTTSWRNRQALPTPDRYKEIQEALAAKGYLQPEDASGRWDQASVEALKKFQADQKLDSTGKLNSLSLIALGLGPRYEPPAPATPAPPADPPALVITTTPAEPAAPPAESH
jgi:Putative peptidoglycan binding domain